MTESNGVDEGGQAYLLPHTHQEIERLKNQHEWIKGAFGGLIKAPISFVKKHQRILDSATADGTWLCDISTVFPPETELMGFDIAPQFYPPADQLPANVKLVQADLSKDLPEEWKQNFDLVHQRLVFPSCPGATIRQFLGRLMGCVKPGGWIQLVEPSADENVSSPDAVGFDVLHRLLHTWMKSPDPKDAILSTLKEGDFINVSIQTKDIVVGVCQHNREADARGRKNTRELLRYMCAIASPGSVGVSGEDWGTVADRLDDDMEKYRIALRHRIIWAQRPE